MPVGDEPVVDETLIEEYEERDETGRRRGLLPWIVLATALLVIFWLISRYSDFGRAPDVEDVGGASIILARVPDVVGLSAEEAERALEAAGFTVERESSFDAVAAPGTVVSQDPPAGERGRSGSTVFITVSADFSFGGGATDAERESKLRVPDVVGLGIDAARQTLEAEGFAVSVSEVYSDSVPKDAVVEQTPAPGVAATSGATVGVMVSQGEESEESFRVPEILGLTKDEALAAIRAAGLEPRVMYQPNGSAVGLVYQQSPTPGTMVPSDRYVFILVGARP